MTGEQYSLLSLQCLSTSIHFPLTTQKFVPVGTVNRNNNVCVLCNFTFVRPDCLLIVTVLILKKLKQKYLHVVAKNDPQAQTVGVAVHGG